MEMVRDFIFLGSQITVDGDCSHDIKRHLLPGRKIMTNLDSILKTRYVILPTKNQRRYFAHKGLSSEGSGFSSSHV